MNGTIEMIMIMMMLWMTTMVVVTVDGVLAGTVNEKDVSVTMTTPTPITTTTTHSTITGMTMWMIEPSPDDDDDDDDRMIPYLRHNMNDRDHHRHVQETDLSFDDIDYDEEKEEGDTFVPSATLSPSVSLVPSSITTFVVSSVSSSLPSSIPSMSATTTTTTIPTSQQPIGIPPLPQPPLASACDNNNHTTLMDITILPQVRYSLYNQDRTTGEDLYTDLYPDTQWTYRPCYFSIRAEIDVMMKSSCAPPSPEEFVSITTNYTIVSVRMVLYYYNDTTTATSIEIVQDHIERTEPYFLYGNNQLRMINTNPNVLPDGEYSIQSTIRINVTRVHPPDIDDNDNDETVTFVVKQIVTPPINFTLYPCVD